MTSVLISAFTLGTYAHHEGLADRFDVLKDGRAKNLLTQIFPGQGTGVISRQESGLWLTKTHTVTTSNWATRDLTPASAFI